MHTGYTPSNNRSPAVLQIGVAASFLAATAGAVWGVSVFFPNLSVLLAILIGGVLGMVVSGLVGTSLARKMVRRQEEMAREARNAREAEKQRQMEALRRAPSGRET